MLAILVGDGVCDVTRRDGQADVATVLKQATAFKQRCF